MHLVHADIIPGPHNGISKRAHRQERTGGGMSVRFAATISQSTGLWFVDRARLCAEQGWSDRLEVVVPHALR